jgi:hypothetical protein
MVARKNTATFQLSTPDLAARIATENALSRMDRNIPVAFALADALKVLSAIEHTTQHEEPDGMVTGNGYACGHRIVDNTMPDLAAHLQDLIEQIREDRFALYERFLASRNLDDSAQVVNHG